jgi:hypothetical protein
MTSTASADGGDVADESQRRAEDRLVAALTAGAVDRPEQRELDRLVGTWRVRGRWEPIPGGTIHDVHGRSENRWEFDGRVLACRGFDADGTLQSMLLVAFDASVGDYAAFSVTTRSTFFAVERGPWLTDPPALQLDGWETVENRPTPIHFRRTLTFPDRDRYDSEISYPDHPPGTFGPLHVQHHRIEAG